MSGEKLIRDAAVPPAHLILLEAAAATLRDIPESAVDLAHWLAAQATGEPDEPKPGEFPKYVNGRIVNNRREERKSLALGPPPEPPPKALSDWDKAAIAFEETAKARTAARAQLEIENALFATRP